jgi:hypothetical protein
VRPRASSRSTRSGGCTADPTSHSAAIAQQPPDLLDHLIQLVGGKPLTLDRRREVAALQAQRVTTGAPEDYAALTSASSSE